MNIIITSSFDVRRGQSLLQSFCGHFLCSCPASIPLISGTSPQVIIFLKAWGEDGTHPQVIGFGKSIQPNASQRAAIL